MWQIAVAALAVGTMVSITGEDQEARAEAIRQGVNSIIQGTAVDYVNYNMIRLYYKV